VKELVLEAEFLSGQKVDEHGDTGMLSLNAMTAAWKKLKTKSVQ